jgi:nucleoside-diphosphate-sugar epimerase
MKILVAGGAGYIGTVLSPLLQKKGYDTEVADACWFGNYLPADIPLVKTDLFRLGVSDLQQYDQVIFLAGVSNDPMAEYSPADNFVYNSSLPAYLAFIAKKAGVRRFIYASSCSVYGFTDNSVFSEDDPSFPAYPYGISKLQGERAVMQMQDEDFSVICFRQATVSGFSPRMRFDLLVNTMVKNALCEGKIVINNPDLWRPLISVQDLCQAYFSALEAPQAISGIFNISMANFQLGELGELVAKQLDKLRKAPVKLEIYHRPDFRNYCVNVEKAERILGYKAAHTVEDIVNDILSGLKYYGDFSDPSFYNINVFRELKATQKNTETTMQYLIETT